MDKEAVGAAANANANFALALFKKLVKSENLIMSPYSVSSVLSQLCLGAEGETASQLKEGLRLKDFDVVKNGFKNFLTQLKTDDALSSANRIYYDANYVFDKAFIKSTQEFFLAEPVGMDFGQAEQSRTAINEWVEEQTNKKIQDLISPGSISALTKLVLVNAIYFKGDWHVKFDKDKTRKGDFHVSKTKTVQADMMFNIKEYG